MTDSFIAVPYMLKVANEIEPRTGNAFVGILTYYFGSFVNAHNYREAVSSKIFTNLDSNKNYCVSFYVKFAGYWFPQFNVKIGYSINKIGALICSDSIIYSLSGDPQIVALHPQVFHSGNFLKDSINWMKISGSFISQGNEKWIHIANFSPDDSTQLFLLPNLTSFEDSALFQSYYLIDDVSVYPCDAPVYIANASRDTCIDAGNSITIGTLRRSEYLYWWYDMQGNLLDTTATITVSPAQTTSYVLVQKDFKFDETRDTVTISVGNCPLPDYSNLDFEIFPNPCSEQVKVRFNAKILEGTVLKLYDMIGQEIAQYPLTGTENIATVNLGELATGVYHATMVVPDVLRKSVKLVVIRYD